MARLLLPLIPTPDTLPMQYTFRQGQGAQDCWSGETGESCCLLVPALFSEAGIKNIFWRCWEHGRVPNKHSSSSERKKGPQNYMNPPATLPHGHPAHTRTQPSKYQHAFWVHLAHLNSPPCVFGVPSHERISRTLEMLVGNLEFPDRPGC